ncbi:condensin complex non-SMC subunit Cnd1 [Coniosporium tulheliwenetii]|uniref:Condensin complex non-SMC subunit Cnd1 n=1 Tax=Coniosporium tulheliwenetii TaxID=3383036 RepID=A0ACC2ZMB7_9PEZI|nr:condensin complex non-SMC subunit Cnd1 [Cladosporium sp. JES 115]
MDDRIEFDINDALKHYLSDPSTVPTPEASSALADCENDPESLTPALINSVLNPIVDAVAETPDAITQSTAFDSLQFLLKCASIAPAEKYKHTYIPDPEPNCALFKLSRCSSLLPTSALSKILDLVVSGLAVEAETANADLEDEHEGVQHHKQLLEIYAFLLQWAITAVEMKAAEKPASSTAGRGRGGAKGAKAKAGKGQDKDGAWDSSGQLQTALDVMSRVLKLKLARVFVTTSERDTFVSLFTRPVYLVFESEARCKGTAIKMHMFKVLCVAVKHHGHAFGAQTSIIQNLSYFEHLSEPMAEFLQILSEQYDYPQLAEEILRELSNKEFNSNDAKGPKSVSTFITKISELAPRLVIKQMTLLAKLLESESYTLRCAIIEVCGNLIAMLSKQEGTEGSEKHKGQINAFFDVLEERFLDVNPYCRCRAIQVYIKLCDLEMKFPKRRQAAAELAARSLEDKSSNVRRNAIKLLGKLISTHPFAALHGGQLAHKDWDARLQAVDAEVAALKPPAELEERENRNDATVDESLLQDATQAEAPPTPAPMTDEQRAAAVEKAQAEAATAEALHKLQLTRRYYTEALRFITVLDAAAPTVTQLLSSKNKSEVIEAMDFFVVADAYKLGSARAGIRRMLRLIWTKGNSDEGKGIQSHLIECYKGLFFDAPDNLSPNDAANYVARNMISLTFGATPAELTSLEHLLSTMMKGELISELVVQKLWAVYGVQRREISASQRRGAIIVLGMLALADPDIVVREMEACLRIGLGELGRRDLGLARYTCVALRRINSSGQGKKEGAAEKVAPRLPNDHAVLVKLAAMCEVVSDSKEWFGVAEQAVGAIYALARHPDTLCSDILRRKTRHVFQAPRPRSPREETPAAEGVSQLASPPPETPPVPVESGKKGSTQNSAIALSHLLFLVGHIAIKQIVHLELCEQDFKRRKAVKEALTSSSMAKTPRKSLAPPTASPTKKKPGKKDAQQQQSEEKDELDLIAGTTEDDFTDAIAHIRERELLYSPTALLSSFGPLCAEICANNTSYPHPLLQSQAALCMAKLMCISSEFCEAHLPLLLTILECSKDAVVRSNLVVALGDMAVAFNHLLDENTDFLYRRLRDGDLSVKRTCLMTLTFLILAGQVKVKGQLGEMAKCLEDSDRRIAEMARMFFAELATKDNAVYNHFVDMFSLLSADEGLDEDGFRKIVKFLAGFVEKDKHAKQLAAKLAARLPRAESERQWNDVAFALGLLQHKDEEIQKLVVEGYKVVQATA